MADHTEAGRRVPEMTLRALIIGGLLTFVFTAANRRR